MKFVATIIGLALALAACSSSKPPASSPSVTTPANSVAGTPSASSTAGTLQGGYGDTKSNQGTTYACEYKGLKATDLKTVVDYVAVTGSSKSPVCSLFAAQTNYKPATGLTIPSSSPVCWMTSPDGGSTARFYTPPGVSKTVVKTECTWQFQDLGR